LNNLILVLVVYCAILGLYGGILTLLLGNYLPIITELTSPEQAVFFFMMELTIADGISGVGAPFICSKYDRDSGIAQCVEHYGIVG